MNIDMYQIDAFTDRLFGGNPAAVCVLDEWLPNLHLQDIASENNLSETAFVAPAGGSRWAIRWFTPTQEVPLCGHATLAAGAAFFLHRAWPDPEIVFDSMSGPLRVSRCAGNRFELGLPAVPSQPDNDHNDVLEAGLGIPPTAVFHTRLDPNLLVVLETQQQVVDLRPDLRMLETLHPYGVAVCAAVQTGEYVSRYFAPSYGIPEDPATGSVQAALAPLWARQWNVGRMIAHQLSRRGATFEIEVIDDRVLLTAGAVTFFVGRINLSGSRNRACVVVMGSRGGIPRGGSD